MHKSYYIIWSKVNWSDFPFNVMYLLCEKLTIGGQRWMLGNQLGDHFSGGEILAGLDLVVNVVRSVWVSTEVLMTAHSETTNSQHLDAGNAFLRTKSGRCGEGFPGPEQC